MPDLRSDIEKLRDKWGSEGRPMFANALDVILSAHPSTEREFRQLLADAQGDPDYEREKAELEAHPIGHDLRERVLEQYEEQGTDDEHGALDGAQFVDGVWYVPKWGCDTLDHVLDALTGHAEAGEWRGPWKCVTCGDEYTAIEANARSNICTRKHKNGDDCRLVPHERRKGGA